MTLVLLWIIYGPLESEKEMGFDVSHVRLGSTFGVDDVVDGICIYRYPRSYLADVDAVDVNGCFPSSSDT